jgi:hypothetical protein
VLRGIFTPKRDTVTEGWRKLYNEALHNLYSSPMKGIWSMHWAMRNAYKIVDSEPEGKRPLERF